MTELEVEFELQKRSELEPTFELNVATEGPKGDPGKDATINGQNTVTISGENGIDIIQEGTELKVSGLPLSESKQDKLNTAQMNAVNSGITTQKVTSYDNHISNTTIHVTQQDKTTWNGKQNALNSTQLEAVNSGITSGGVSQITTNKNNIASEVTNRQNADNNLQSQIDAIVASSDVTDIVGTYAQLQAYDTSTLPPNSIIKVLKDESQNDETTYYRWVITGGTGRWVLIGEEGPYYTKSQADERFATAAQGAKADSAVQSITTGNTNGTISVDGTDVQVKGLGSAAYTSDSDYATSAQGAKADTAVQPAALSGYVPYTSATAAVDLNGQDLKNVDNLAVGSSSVDSNEKILSVGQNRIVTNNKNGLFISSTTSQTRKGMYGVPMALEIQFNSNNQAYSYPLGFHDMNANNQGGQFLFTSFSGTIGAASSGDVMVENDKGGLIFNTGSQKTGAKMRFRVGNWQQTPQLTISSGNIGVNTLNPSSQYALDVNGAINSNTDVKVNGVSLQLPSRTGNQGKFLTTDGSSLSWATVSAGSGANVKVEEGGGGSSEDLDLSEVYVDDMGASYGFEYDSMENTITNTNKNVDDSFAYGKIRITVPTATTMTVYFKQSSEPGYDFGELSILDENLSVDANSDSSDILAFDGYNYDEYEGSVEYSLSAGTHFITFKYIKDESSFSGEDLFSITRISLSSSSASSRLINTETQEEIQVSQLGDLPEVIEQLEASIPDTSNLVTINTTQTIQAAKAIFGTDVSFGSDQTQKNLLAVISNNNSTSGTWVGRLTVGAKNKTFIIGTYGTICVLGAHSWTNAQQGTGAAWEDVYINPDGNKAVYIGGSPINNKQAILKIQNVNANTTGTVQINRSSNLSNNFKDVACWDDSVTKFDFTQISGYNSSVNQTLTHDSSGNLKWVNS